MGRLELIDIAVILAYFALVLAVAWWAYLKKKKSASDYFLAGRDLGWLAVGASLFSTNIGSEHLIGLAGTGAASGLAVGHFEWLASLILLLLGWLFVPFYLKSGVTTMPEFLERRYNSASRWYFTSISIVGYVLTKISVSLFAGGVILQEVAGIGLWQGAVAVVLITGLYTIIGGLRAVVYTDLMQTFVIIAGTLVLLFIGMNAVGGWSGLKAGLPQEYFSMWKSAAHADFPWTGIVFGAPILGVWYWCTDQYIVQRTLSARNENEAQSGTIFAGYLKILPFFLFILPGMIAAVLFKDLTPETSNDALPRLVLHLLGPGLKGFFVAALLAALMSSLSSCFNSCSTLVTWDVYKKLHPQADDRRLVAVGRWATVGLVMLGLLWIPFMKHISSQLYIYLQSVQGYIAPPIAACFLLGLFIPRLNGPGAISSLGTGFILGGLRLVLELANGADRTGLTAGGFWKWLAEINFLHFAAGLFIMCSLVLVVVSLLTAPPEPKKLEGLVWQKKPRSFHPTSSIHRRANIILSAALVLFMTLLWIVFR